MRFTNKFKATSLIALALVLGACSGGELPISSSISNTSSSSSSSPSSSSSSISSSSIPSYLITFVNYDDSVLHTTNVIEGQDAMYDGPTPTRPATSEFTYVFTGWDRTLTNVTSAFTTKAQFSSAYTVTWQNHDGTVLETDTNVPYGTTPTFNSSNPTKTSTDDYDYTFTGWLPEITPVTENVTYVAQFTENLNYIPITNAQELSNIRNNLSGNYRLMNDIDLESVEWQPIGTGSTSFSGTLDGKEFTISNLTITQTQAYVGLFARNIGTITNLNLSNVAVSMIGAIDTTLYVGSLIGFNSGRVSNIKTIGGQIDIRVRGSQPCYLGGVIGRQNKSNISNILNSISVTGNGTTHTGGVIGYNYIDSSSRIITLDNVINFGNIESNEITVGGLVGYQNSGDLIINDSINAGIIKGLDFVGGLVGGDSGTTNTVIVSNSSNLAFIDGTTGGAVGGLVAYALNVEINNSFNNGQVIGKGTCTTFYICGSGGLIGASGRANITNSYNLGDINSRVTGGLIGLTDLFNITSSANFGDIHGSNGVGGLVGESNYSSGSSNLIKSSNYGLVKGARKSGGLIGYSYVSIDISESMNIGDVTGTREVGGLIGYARGNNTGITNSVNYANVSGTGDEIGGFIGSGYFTNISILKSLNFGQIRGENELGGFIGLNYVSQQTLFVDNSAQFGSIFSTLTNPSGGFNVGDIAGNSKNNDFLNTYFYGNLYSNQNSITGKRLAIAIQDLNIINLAFFTTTLNFNSSIWNFADLNLASGYPPTLKNLPTLEEIIELLESTTSTINDLILVIEEMNDSNR